jgi:hypothetical protein
LSRTKPNSFGKWAVTYRGTPGSKILSQAREYVRSVRWPSCRTAGRRKDFQRAFGPHTDEIMGDIPNYTQPSP